MDFKAPKISPEEEQARKKAIFDSMSPRGQKRIIAKGYEGWDPFDMPKEPADLRLHKESRTAAVLMKMFLETCSSDEYSNEYGEGVFEMCKGVVGKEEKFLAMYDFSIWYHNEKQKGE